MSTHPSDEQLMLRFTQETGSDSQRAFAELYARHKGPFYRFIQKSVNQEQDCHEIYQEWWFKIIHHKQRFDSDLSFTTWAYTIGRRLLIDHYRKTGKHLEMTDQNQNIEEVDQGIKTPDNEFEQQQMFKQLQQTVEQLPVAQKEVFLLKQEAGLNIREIAAITEQQYDKVKSQYRYAVHKIKMALERFR